MQLTWDAEHLREQEHVEHELVPQILVRGQVLH